ncbi:hypothetical protein EDD21DRAFT_390844 [Dissophora ornata]|nr:hypothetical protein EDD21DRAFT_390844 [Dissophora ornata]
MKNDRKRDRDGDTRYSRDSSRFATKDSSSYSESRARKRHARSRSRSRSRNRSRSRSMPRSPSRSRDRTPSRSRIRSRSRTPVPTRQRLLTPPPPPRTPSPAPRTPSPAPRIPPHQMQSTYPDIDDASSFSTLSSPASFSPSLSPRSMPPSPIKELSPIKRRRMENIAQAEASYSSPSSLSSLSPDRRNHASPERGSRPSDLDISPYPSTPSEAEIAAQNQTNGTVHHLTKAPASQHSLELELFGVADGDKGRGGSKNRNGTNKKQENGVASKTTPAIKSNGEDNEEEYASLGSLATELKGNGLSTKNSNSHAGNHQMRRHSIKALKGTREIITINTKKGTVTSAVVPISPKPKSIQKNGHRPSKSISSSKESKEDSQKLTNSTTNGSGARRMSILHSDQIVAAAMNRYKNHFHMLVEDSDSTVASNPSSTGADTMHVALEYPGKDAREK